MNSNRFNPYPETHSLQSAELAEALKDGAPKYASWKYKKIVKQIREFEADLDENHEVALALASFGTSMILFVSDIGYQNPDMLYFFGTINGKKAQLIQHINQLNFLLLSVEKKEPNAPPRRIGFALSDGDQAF